MTQITLEEVTNEVRAEFHIPPFFKDDDLKRLVNQSDAYLSMLVDGINYGSDLVARDLLKYRVYYAYNGKSISLIQTLHIIFSRGSSQRLME